jgi:endonuclease/exonuclease/phosphatase family metal-dependent hydrolase
MKRRTAIIMFIVCVVIIIILAIFVYSYYKFVKSQDEYLLNETFTIANWNLQIYGDKKANNTLIVDYYAEKISNYDVVFVQEIRDKDGSAFDELCNRLPDYECVLYSRAGRSSSKEQYGILYLEKFDLEVYDYNPDPLDRWERPPIRATISLNNYSIMAYNIHTKPDNATQEIYLLEELVESEDGNMGNKLILGDLNADCNYYDEYSRDAFSKLDGWYWIIKNSDDTTSGSSACAYDRIILNSDANKEYVSYGIERTEYSDHYLVWARLRNNNYEKDKTFKGFLSYLIK